MITISQNSITTKNENNKKHKCQTLLGLTGGAGAGFVLRKGLSASLKPYHKNLLTNLDNFTLQDKELLAQEADRMIKESNIQKKGFKGIIWVVENNSKDIKKPIINDYNKINPKKNNSTFLLLEKIADKLDPQIPNASNKVTKKEAIQKFLGGILRSALKGSFSDKSKLAFIFFISDPINKMTNLLTGNFNSKKNSALKESMVKIGCFEPFSNRIFTSKPSSVLHEVGHAINRNTNFLTRMPSNLKLISQTLINIAILTALLSKKPVKTDENQNKTKSPLKKLKEFTHNNIGSMVVGLSIPLLTEEGLASYRATKFANSSKILSDTTKKQHSKSLKLAFGTYLFATAALASIAKLSVFTKDKIIEHTSKNNVKKAENENL